MLQNKEAVIFDLDGTLVDSMWMWHTIDREYLDRFQIPLPSDLQSKIEGMSFTETAEYFKSRFDLPDNIEKIKADLINNLLPQIEEKLGYPINKNLVLIDNKYIIENFYYNDYFKQ